MYYIYNFVWQINPPLYHVHYICMIPKVSIILIVSLVTILIISVIEGNLGGFEIVYKVFDDSDNITSDNIAK